MWRNLGASADSFYQVRPECTDDVPETKFRIKVIGIFCTHIIIIIPHILSVEVKAWIVDDFEIMRAFQIFGKKVDL